MNRRYGTAAGLFAAGWMALAAGGAETGTATATNPAIVVTATRPLRERMEVPASVSVLTARDIAAAPARNVDDLLRTEAGLSLMQVTGMGQGMPSRINVRGVPGHERTLLLQDGMPLNEAATRFMSLNEVPLSALRQVEVIRGPFSSLYGTDAFGGVINLVTAEPSGETTFGLRVAGGNGDYVSGGVTHGAGVGGVKYALDADVRTVGNYLGRNFTTDRRYDYAARRYAETRVPVENHDYRDRRLVAKAVTDLGDSTELTFLGRYFEGDLGYGRKSVGPAYPEAVDNVTRTRTVLGGAVLAGGLPAGELDLRLSGYARRQWRQLWGLDLDRMDGEVPVFARSFSETVSDEWQADAGGDWKVGRGQTLSLGVEVRRSAADFRPLSREATGQPLTGREGVDAAVWNTGIYLQDEVALDACWRLIAGVRMDHHSEFGSAWSPRAGVVGRVTDDTTVRASAGRAFRAPSLTELFQPPLTFGNVTFRANPDLKPEYITAADAEVEHDFGPGVSSRLAVFYNDMKDLVANSAAGDVLTNVNLDRARSAGVEASLRCALADGLDVTVSYTWVDAKDKETDRGLEYIPDHSGSMGLAGRQGLGRWVLEGRVTATYVGRRGFQDWTSGQWYALGDVWRTDLGLRASRGEGFHVAVAVQNLTDETFQESFLMPVAPGRMASVEVGIAY